MIININKFIHKPSSYGADTSRQDYRRRPDDDRSMTLAGVVGNVRTSYLTWACCSRQARGSGTASLLSGSVTIKKQGINADLRKIFPTQTDGGGGLESLPAFRCWGLRGNIITWRPSRSLHYLLSASRSFVFLAPFFALWLF